MPEFPLVSDASTPSGWSDASAVTLGRCLWSRDEGSPWAKMTDEEFVAYCHKWLPFAEALGRGLKSKD